MMTTETQPALNKRGGALRTILRWTPPVLFGVFFALQGAMKLSPGSPWPSMFEAWGYPSNVYLLVGLVELLAGVALFVPRVAGYAALTLAVVMCGAGLTHAVHVEWFNVGFTAVLAVGLFALARARL
jgi:putative oxidoreductase